ncbi:MAG TPA: fibronectin type III domain-containing protein [Myxococcales bacterium]|nr:fibronectin type III domain-containing protein [Myxococcales bacterium]
MRRFVRGGGHGASAFSVTVSVSVAILSFVSDPSVPAISNPVTVHTEWPAGSAWQEGEPLPDGFTKAAVAFAGHLFAAGPIGIYSSAIDAGGRPGPWAKVADSPTPSAGVTAVALRARDAVRAFLYVTSSFPSFSETSGDVWVIEVKADGSAGAAVPVTSLSPGRYGTSLAVVGPHLYALGGEWWSGGSYTGFGTGLDYVDVAEIGADGSLGSWRRTTPLPRPGSWVAMARGSRLYALRPHGFGADAVLAEVAADGSVGPWRRASAQPDRPFASGGWTAALQGDFLYLAGGPLPPGSTQVAVGRIGPDGDLVSWEENPADAFNGPRGFPALASDGRHVFLLGGGFQDSQFARPDPATGHLAPGTPTSAPSAPLRVRAAAGDASATVSWDPPAHPSGVTGYTITGGSMTSADPAVQVEAPAGATSALVTGLKNGQSYLFAVAVNTAAGAGPGSGPTGEVIPSASRRWRSIRPPGLQLRDSTVVGSQFLGAGFAVGYAAAPLAPDGDLRMLVGPGYQGEVRRQWAQAWRATGPHSACAYQISGLNNDGEMSCFGDDDFSGRVLGGGRFDFPAERLDGAGAIAGSSIYLIGGFAWVGDTRVPQADVWVATLGSDGLPGAFVKTAALPEAASGLDAKASGSDLYVATDGVLLHARAGADGQLTAWAPAAPPLSAATGRARLSVRGGLLYLAGQDGTFAVGRTGGGGEVASWEIDPAESLQPPVSDLFLGDGRLYANTASGLVVAGIDAATGHLMSFR